MQFTKVLMFFPSPISSVAVSYDALKKVCDFFTVLIQVQKYGPVTILKRVDHKNGVLKVADNLLRPPD